MSRTVSLIVLLLCFGMGAPRAVSAEAETQVADREAVRAAVLDYVEGVYEASPERIRRSVHPNLAKLGWGRDQEGNYHEYPMTFEQLVQLAKSYNADGSRVPKGAPKGIEIYEVLDKTASIKLTAHWGIDTCTWPRSMVAG